MATPKKENPVQGPFVNNNNNTNNINVNVQMPKEKRSPRKQQEPVKSDKPNWILKAVIIAIITGLLIPLAYDFVVRTLERGHGKPPVIIDGSSNQ